MFVSKLPYHTNKSLGKKQKQKTQHLINAKPPTFEETLLTQQQKKRKPSQIEANAQHLIPGGWQASTYQPISPATWLRNYKRKQNENQFFNC